MMHFHAAMRFVGTLFAALLFISVALEAGASSKPVRAYLIQAAFLYDMAKSTVWPRSTGEALDFCIHGPDPFGAASDLIDGQPVHDRVLNVRKLAEAGHLTGCDMLFLGDSGAATVQRLLASIEGRAILTISEMPNFVQYGGMVQLKEVDNRLRFDMNLMAIERVGLIVSTDAAELADSVTVDPTQSVQR